MAEVIPATSEDSAEKAYAQAAEAVAIVTPVVETESPVEAAPVVQAAPAPVVAPKAKRASKPAAPKPVVEAAPASAPVVKLRKSAKPAARKAKQPKVQPVAAKPAKITKPKAAAKPAAKISKPSKLINIPQLKDTIMTKTTTTDFTATIKGVAADVQSKAKAAFEKGSAAVTEANEFAKGNVEAFVASGKILAAGLQDLGTGYVAESKSAFETLTADVKALAAVKSPTDFFKLQGELLRRNFDAAVAATSKNSEAAIKLANEVAAPISGRVSLVIEKVKKAA